MPKLNIVQSVNLALRQEMERNPDVLILGEDVGRNGGVFRATEGLQEKFGAERVVDTPLSESGIVGVGIGLAVYGMVPVVEIQFLGFIYAAMEQLISHAARIRTRSRGRFSCPLTVRAPYGGGIHAPEHHSESTEALFVHTPGLKVVVPSTPAETKGLLTAAIRDPDPVIFLEPARIYRAIKEEVPEGDYVIPLGKARVVQEGAHITLISWGAMLRPTLQAAEMVREEGIEAEVIDMRTLYPLDTDTIIESVKKTSRAIVIDEGSFRYGVTGEIASVIAEGAFYDLDGPVRRLGARHVPIPFSPALEDVTVPTEQDVVALARQMCNR